MTATLTLTDFLLARIAEDEHAAASPSLGDVTDLGEGMGGRFGLWSPPKAAPGHWGNSRVLRECEAKRAVVELHPCDDCGMGDDPCRTLKILALPYADHPDYREAWRP